MMELELTYMRAAPRSVVQVITDANEYHDVAITSEERVAESILDPDDLAFISVPLLNRFHASEDLLRIGA